MVKIKIRTITSIIPFLPVHNNFTHYFHNASRVVDQRECQATQATSLADELACSGSSRLQLHQALQQALTNLPMHQSLQQQSLIRQLSLQQHPNSETECRDAARHLWFFDLFLQFIVVYYYLLLLVDFIYS